MGGTKSKAGSFKIILRLALIFATIILLGQLLPKSKSLLLAIIDGCARGGLIGFAVYDLRNLVRLINGQRGARPNYGDH